MSAPATAGIDRDLSSPICDFNFADLAGYLLARQMLPSDVRRLQRLLLSYSSNAIAGLDVGLSRPSNFPPRNSLLLKEACTDRGNLPGKRSRSLVRRGALQ